MFFRFINDKSIRFYTDVEAKSLKEAIKKVNEGNCEWDRESDLWPVYHRIEIAKNRKAYEEGDFENNEEDWIEEHY